jgi:hypothetical protein
LRVPAQQTRPTAKFPLKTGGFTRDESLIKTRKGRISFTQVQLLCAAFRVPEIREDPEFFAGVPREKRAD